MKLAFIFAFVSILSSCQGQTKTKSSEWADSLGMVSRKKADLLLEKIDTLNGIKILYSLSDSHYYIIVNDKNQIKEYYVKTDKNGGIKELENLKISNIEVIEKAFNLSQYHTEFITDMPEAKYVRGKPSYFVIKDDEGRRYGEYSLSSFTLPSPINSDLYAYLTKRLSNKISED